MKSKALVKEIDLIYQMSTRPSVLNVQSHKRCPGIGNAWDKFPMKFLDADGQYPPYMRRFTLDAFGITMSLSSRKNPALK